LPTRMHDTHTSSPSEIQREKRTYGRSPSSPPLSGDQQSMGGGKKIRVSRCVKKVRKGKGIPSNRVTCSGGCVESPPQKELGKGEKLMPTQSHIALNQAGPGGNDVPLFQVPPSLGGRHFPKACIFGRTGQDAEQADDNPSIRA